MQTHGNLTPPAFDKPAQNESAASFDATLHEIEHHLMSPVSTKEDTQNLPVFLCDQKCSFKLEHIENNDSHLETQLHNLPIDRKGLLERLQSVVDTLIEKTVTKYVALDKERAGTGIERKLVPATDSRENRKIKLTQWLKKWASRDCLWRYLRAAKWDFDSGVKRLEMTMNWRLDFRPDLIDPDMIAVESESGKMYLNGFDYYGRPLMIMKPRMQNTKPTTRQIDHLVYLLESAIRLMPNASVEQLALVIDFDGFSMSTAPSVSVSKEFLTIVGNHYPERLGVAYLISPTWYFMTFFKLISPFIDPVTKSKLWTVDLKSQHTLEQAANAPNKVTLGEAGSATITVNKSGMTKTCLWHHIPKQYIERPYGGDFNFVYEHNQYWPTLVNFIRSHPVPF